MDNLFCADNVSKSTLGVCDAAFAEDEDGFGFREVGRVKNFANALFSFAFLQRQPHSTCMTHDMSSNRFTGRSESHYVAGIRHDVIGIDHNLGALLRRQLTMLNCSAIFIMRESVFPSCCCLSANSPRPVKSTRNSAMIESITSSEKCSSTIFAAATSISWSMCS